MCQNNLDLDGYVKTTYGGLATGWLNVRWKVVGERRMRERECGATYFVCDEE